MNLKELKDYLIFCGLGGIAIWVLANKITGEESVEVKPDDKPDEKKPE